MRYLGLALLFLVSSSWSMGAKAGDPTAADFIRSCDAEVNSLDCLDDYVVYEVQATTCEPKVTAKMGEDESLPIYRSQILAVVAWLKQHPEYDSKNEGVGIIAALRAIYPCK